jgi:hypothetical protein
MNKELTMTYIQGQESNWYKGECQCGMFNVHLPSQDMIIKYHTDHLYLVHAEYVELWQPGMVLLV